MRADKENFVSKELRDVDLIMITFIIFKDLLGYFLCLFFSLIITGTIVSKLLEAL